MKFFRKHKKKKIALLVLLVIILALIGGYGYIAWSFFGGSVDVVPAEEVDPTAKEVKIAEQEPKTDEVVNILLVGTDSRDPDTDMGRSDSMMLVSFNQDKEKVTAVSFLRDSLVDIPGYGKSRLGHTYAYGGVGLTINTLNETYELDIQKYITIDFASLVSVIDEIGGVEVYISPEEAEYYRTHGMPNISEGQVTLTGSQALAHARNRTLGSDFERTRRQRSVVYGIYRKIIAEKDAASLLPLINYCMEHVKTNMGVTEIYDLATKVLEIEDLRLQSAAVPEDGTYTPVTYEGMDVLEIDFKANKEFLDTLLY